MIDTFQLLTGFAALNTLTKVFFVVVLWVGPVAAAYFLVRAAVEKTGPVGTAMTGGLNRAIGGIQKSQAAYRSNARKEGIQNFKTGSGEGRFRQTALVRNLGQRVGVGWKGRFGGVGALGRDRATAARDNLIGNAAQDEMKNPAFAGQADNDGVLRAAATGRTFAESVRNQQRIFGTTQAEAERNARQVQATFGFGSKQQVAAAQQLVNTGTGYDDMRQQVETLAIAAGGNTGTASRLAGFANAVNKSKGKWDLAPSFGTLNNLVQDRMAGGERTPSQTAYDMATLAAITNSTDANTLARTAKPRVFDNMEAVLQRARDPNSEMTAVERDQVLRTVSARTIEMRQNQAYMSGENSVTTQRLVETLQPSEPRVIAMRQAEDVTAAREGRRPVPVDQEHENQIAERELRPARTVAPTYERTLEYYGPQAVADGEARLMYQSVDPITGRQLARPTDNDPTRPGGPMDPNRPRDEN